MRASASMPLVSRPVEIDGGKFIDGGTTDSIPLEYFESIGYRKNVVVLTQPRDFVKQPVSGMLLTKIMLRKYPELVKALERRHNVYNEQKNFVFSREKAGNALVICPEKPLGISRTEKDINELERVYQEGRAVAMKRLEEIKAFLDAAL